MKLTDRINELAEFEVPYKIVRLQGGPYSINRELRGTVNLPGIHAERRGILGREYDVVATGRLGFEMHDDQKVSTPRLPFSIGNIVGFDDGGIEVIDTQEGEKHHYPVHPGSYLFRLLVAEIGEQRVSEVIGSELTLGNFGPFFKEIGYKVRDIKEFFE
ncbi:MAG: hypothetical protein AABX33_04370 [Nanoarchaeota archaeon]